MLANSADKVKLSNRVSGNPKVYRVQCPVGSNGVHLVQNESGRPARVGIQTVRPINDLLQNPEDFLATLKESSSPVLLTIAGEGRLIVQIPEAYQQRLDQILRYETLEASREGLTSVELGKGRPVAEFFAELKAELLAQEAT